jgi:hypothetical protein
MAEISNSSASGSRCAPSQEEKYPLRTPLKRKENLDKRERISAGLFEAVAKVVDLPPPTFERITDEKPTLRYLSFKRFEIRDSFAGLTEISRPIQILQVFNSIFGALVS